METRFEHIVSTHFTGRYYTMRSEGFESTWENKCLSLVPALQSYSFINTDSCLYQRAMSDKLIMLGYSENAVDDYDGRSFVNQHVIIVPYEDYIGSDLHPEIFQKHFLTYTSLKQLVTPPRDPSSITLGPISPSEEYTPDSGSLEKLLEKKADLIAFLDSLISASLGKDKFTVDFKTIEEAKGLLIAALWLIPKEIRAWVPFCIGVKPDNDKQPDLYRVILRVWPEPAYPLSSLRHTENFELSNSIARLRHPASEINELHRTFNEIYRSLELTRSNLGHQALIEGVLLKWGSGRRNGGVPGLDEAEAFLRWTESLNPDSLAPLTYAMDSIFKPLSNLDSRTRDQCLDRLVERLEGLVQQDLTEKLRLLVDSNEGQENFFCVLPKLTLKLVTIMDKDRLSDLATGYMEALLNAMREPLPHHRVPLRFKHDERNLLSVINLHLRDSLISLNARFKDDKEFKDKYTRFQNVYNYYLVKRAGKI